VLSYNCGLHYAMQLVLLCSANVRCPACPPMAMCKSKKRVLS